jgi:16S rRNA processing protein RimM
MTHSAQTWIVLAHLLRPQGRKGEVLAELFTDFPERFDSRKRVYLAAPGFEGQPDEARTAEVIHHWLPVGKNQGRIVLHFEGIDSISDAESIAGQDVLIPEEERLPLDDDSVYINELIGCTVYDSEAPVGIVEDVQFPTNPDGTRRLEEAAPLLEVRSPEGNEILIPFAKAFLVALDSAHKRIEMTLPEGLIEINQSPSSENQATQDQSNPDQTERDQKR